MSEEYEQFMKSGSENDLETLNLHTPETSEISYVKIVDVSIPFLSILLLVFKYTIAFFIVSLFIFFAISMLTLLGFVSMASIF
ncbi:hypothetical protein N9A69_02045 [Gammaproteobacteria bacterium]|nr:hypothetical protein [Gammaproteobacteria bacterium]MDA7844347.1 hypothetical protein [Gammaproteobacteria bacterium]MDA8933920.1 hypothetical protein [Gammaproteobacteria bacterium]